MRAVRPGLTTAQAARPRSLPAGERLTTATVTADGRGYKRLPIKDPTLSVACAGVLVTRRHSSLRARAGMTRVLPETASTSVLGRRRAPRRLTSNPVGRCARLLLSGRQAHRLRSLRRGRIQQGLFVINIDGSRQHRITPAGLDHAGRNTATGRRGGTTSSSRASSAVSGRGSIWVIRADGSRLRKDRRQGASVRRQHRLPRAALVAGRQEVHLRRQLGHGKQHLHRQCGWQRPRASHARRPQRRPQLGRRLASRARMGRNLSSTLSTILRSARSAMPTRSSASAGTARPQHGWRRRGPWRRARA